MIVRHEGSFPVQYAFRTAPHCIMRREYARMNREDVRRVNEKNREEYMRQNSFIVTYAQNGDLTYNM
jgi:hypothetical protein